VDVLHLSPEDEPAREAALARTLEQMSAAIRLDASPLVRVALVRCGEREYEMLWACHHLVGDGASSWLLWRDLLSLYARGAEAPPARDPFVEYLAAVDALPGDPALAAHEAFWRRHAAGPALRVPLDWPGGEDEARSEVELRFAGRDAGQAGLEAPDFELAAAGLYRALADWTGHSHVTVAHRLHRRQFAEGRYASVVGCLAGDVPLALEVNGHADLLPRFRRAYRGIPAAGVTYDTLALGGRVPFAHEATEVRLNYQPFAGALASPELGVASFDTRLFQPDAARRPYRLDLIVRLQPGGWVTLARYSRHRHEEATIRALLSRWWEAVGDLAASAGAVELV
jgi:hypothetical protein